MLGSWRVIVAGALGALAACGGSDAELPPGTGRRCVAAVGVGPTADRVAWHAPPGAEAREALERWCAAVGPAVLSAPRPSSAPPSAGAAAELVVLAWNVKMGAGRLDRLVGDLRAGRLTGGEAVGDFVLLVQEAHRTAAAVPAADEIPPGARDGGWDPTGGEPDIVAAAERLGLHLVYAPSMRNGARPDRPNTDHGNAILSTLPLRRPAVIDLGVGLQRRVVVAAEVRLGDGAGAPPLRVYSVHLDNATWRRPLASLGRVRSRQAAMVAAVLPDTGAVLVGGDLNTWLRETDEAAYLVLRGRLTLPAEQPTAATATRLGMGRRLDWLLLGAPAGWEMDAHVVPDRYGSDHNPVLGRVRVPAGMAHVLRSAR